MKLLDWLDDRTGYRALVSHALGEKVLGGASFAYVFGSVLTFLLLQQMVTGVFLAMYYSPSSTDAWASVAHIQDTVTLGWFLRGLHSYGASAMVIVAGLHLLQTAVWGAYKKPRELNWIIGVLMLGLILAFALTGYLLPWDQKGYWATKVATGIAGTTPVAGEALQQVVQGGNEYGNLTLTRFFTIHVFILPALILGLLVMHLALFRRHGVTPRWDKSEARLEGDAQPFWPDQLFRDMVAIAVCFAAIVAWSVWHHGASLDAPADPSSNFDARPEWYFRPLFQLLKYFHGPMETVVALGTPVIVGGLLLGLPFVDRKPDRSPRRRAGFLAVIGALIAGFGALTMISFREDAADEKLGERLEDAEALATKARALAAEYGVPSEGGTAVYATEPYAVATALWKEHCASCHAAGKDRTAPLLTAGYSSREWIQDFLKNPDDERFFGKTGIKKMKPVEASPEELEALAEAIYAESGAEDARAELVTKGRALFDDGECSGCHEREGDEPGGDGPNLYQRGSLEWLVSIIGDAAQPRYFGDLDEMDRFADQLSIEQRRHLAELLLWLRTATPEEAAERGM